MTNAGSACVAVAVLSSLLWAVALAGYDSFGLSNALDGPDTDGSPSVLLRNARHRANGDQGRSKSALYCHTCSSAKHGELCSHLAPNSTTFSAACGGNQTVCMVKRFSVTENSTAPSILWSIERNCSSKCEPGCLILGERTKIHVCISCCTEDSCNVGSNTVSLHLTAGWLILSLFSLIGQLTRNHI